MAYILVVIFSLLCCTANADVFVVHKDGVVSSLSEQNDAVIPQGYSLEVLKGTIQDLSLSRPIDEYSFVGKKFKVNSKVIKEKEEFQLAEDKKNIEKKQKIKTLKEKLKTLGLTEDEIKELVQ